MMIDGTSLDTGRRWGGKHSRPVTTLSEIVRIGSGEGSLTIADLLHENYEPMKEQGIVLIVLPEAGSAFDNAIVIDPGPKRIGHL